MGTITATRVNRLLMTMAAIGLTRMSSAWSAGTGYSCAGSSGYPRLNAVFKSPTVARNPRPERHRGGDGRAVEDQVIYIFHSQPGSHISQALAGFHMMPARRRSSVLRCWRLKMMLCLPRALALKR